MGEALFPAEKIHHYTGRTPLFTELHVDEEIQSLFEREVELPSGGSLVIDYTEALTAIDVNSGSFKGNMPHGELAYLINKTAVPEIARQIRLRGIGGIIMIDFIDMEKKSQQEELVRLLKEEVRKDRVKTVVCGMTSLGLVEMTRKRTVHRLWQNYYDTCPLCKGEGRIPSAEAMAGKILEDLRGRAAQGYFKTDLLIQCESEVAKLLCEEEWREKLRNLVHHEVTVEDSGNPHREVYMILSK